MSTEPIKYDVPDTLPPPRPTTPPVRRSFLWVLLLLCLITATVYGVPYMLDQIGYAYEIGRARASTEALAKLDNAGALVRASELFRLATNSVSPAVVHIRTQSYGKDGGMNLGSGVVIDKGRGHIVTNEHVIHDADVITVRVGQTEMMGELVGSDPKTDLAVVKVKGSLPMAASWGDSEKLEQGDWVLAIGSPFGLDSDRQARGIVSATSRNNLNVMGQDAYQDFIQTDVAINPGNSGGPLIDLRGRVVGINTAISMISRDPGNQGIGFAISSAMAKRVVGQLIKSGKMIRGYLGVIATVALARSGSTAQCPRREGGPDRLGPARQPQGGEGRPEARRRDHGHRRQAGQRRSQPQEPDLHPRGGQGGPGQVRPERPARRGPGRHRRDCRRPRPGVLRLLRQGNQPQHQTRRVAGQPGGPGHGSREVRPEAGPTDRLDRPSAHLLQERVRWRPDEYRQRSRRDPDRRHPRWQV